MAKDKGGKNVNPLAVEGAGAVVGVGGDREGSSQAETSEAATEPVAEEVGLDGKPVEDGVGEDQAGVAEVDVPELANVEAAKGELPKIDAVAVKPRSAAELASVGLAEMSVEEIAVHDASLGDPEGERAALHAEIERLVVELGEHTKTVNRRVNALKDEANAKFVGWQAALERKRLCAVEIARRAAAVEVAGQPVNPAHAALRAKLVASGEIAPG